jgi:hypothetical protein
LETHLDTLQRLLAEVASAGACLLIPERKQRYDLALRARLASAASSTVDNPVTPAARHLPPTSAAKPPPPPTMTPRGVSTAVVELLNELPKPEWGPNPPSKWDEWQKRLTHLAYVLLGIVVVALIITLVVWIMDQVIPQDLEWWNSSGPGP